MQKIALTERSKQLIKNYILGGAALGGSAALTTSLLNYLKMLKEENAAAEDTAADDDTLYVNLPPKQAAQQDTGFSPANLAAGGLALTGGVLSTLGTYALIRKLYQNMKKKQLQEQLDQAQQTFLTSAEEEAKSATTAPAYKPMGVGEFLTAAPVTFALLSALAGGALTNMALNKTFPRVKKDNTIGPKKIVLRRSKEEEPEEEEGMPEQEKMSSEDSAMEFLVGLAMHNKAASVSDLNDIVHAVAQGRRDEFISNMLEYGFDSAMDTIKGAAEKPIDVVSRQLAIGACVKSAALSPVVSLLAAAEYNDMAPRFTKMASALSEHNRGVLVKIASVLGDIHRIEVLSKLDESIEVSKEAAAQPMDIATILDLVNSMRDGAEGDMEGMEESDDMAGEDSIASNEEKQVNDLHPTKSLEQAPELIDELDSDDDLIDQAMSQPTAAAKAVAVESK